MVGSNSIQVKGAADGSEANPIQFSSLLLKKIKVLRELKDSASENGVELFILQVV